MSDRVPAPTGRRRMPVAAEGAGARGALAAAPRCGCDCDCDCDCGLAAGCCGTDTRGGPPLACGEPRGKNTLRDAGKPCLSTNPFWEAPSRAMDSMRRNTDNEVVARGVCGLDQLLGNAGLLCRVSIVIDLQGRHANVGR